MTSIFEYDQASHEWALHEDGYKDGCDKEVAEAKSGDIGRIV